MAVPVPGFRVTGKSRRVTVTARSRVPGRHRARRHRPTAPAVTIGARIMMIADS